MKQIRNLMGIEGKFSIVIALLVLIPSSLDAIRVTCEYKFIPWPVLGNSYTCQIRNFNSTQKQSITKVSGSHLTRFSDQNVRAFDIDKQTCHFIPERIKNFFPNIELLQVWRSNLKQISKEDLPFPKLRVLHLHANDLESLPNDLFSFNPQLVRIDFRFQKLKLIGYKIFDNMSRLKLANFQSSGCVDHYGENGSKGIESLRSEIRVNCQPIDEILDELRLMKEKIAALEAKSLEIEDQSRKIDHKEIPLMEKLDAKIAQLMNENDEGRERLQIVTKNFLTLIERMETVEKSLKNGSCSADKISNDLCQLEKEQFQRTKRELSAIDLRCENVEWTSSSRCCDVRNIKIIQSEVEIRKIVSGKMEFDSLSFVELRIFNERVMFLPLKLSALFHKLKVLSVVDCGLITINGDSLNGMERLQKLTLSHNKLQEIDDNDFMNLRDLTSLDLSHNKIDYISDGALRPLYALVDLKLNDNSLLKLTAEAFSSQANLKLLFLQNNQLLLIPKDILRLMKKLEFADFSGNQCVNIASTKTSSVTLKNLETFFAENCS